MCADRNTPPSDVTETAPSGPTGRALIAARQRTLPTGPGVYRMIGADEQVLYVGKAKNLKKRVASYAKPTGLPFRIAKMVGETVNLVVVTTHTEAEALLLEANLIKQLRPRFNILLRDDKSFPYILLTGDDAWARLLKHRGAQSRPGDYFGPFASAGAVNKTLSTLQRAFPLRSCTDAQFAARTRPCLEYQIKRCTAPCVGRIAPAAYADIVDQARAFLAGRSQAVQDKLSADMERAAEALEFERAAALRDRIKALTAVQAKQDINVAGLPEADVIAAHQEGGQTCVQVFFFRNGQNFGNRSYFPRHSAADAVGAVLAAFIGQFYAARTPPKLILLGAPVPEPALLAEALSIRADAKVELAVPQRGAKRQLTRRATENAQAALAQKLAEGATQAKLLDGVAAAFGLAAAPQRIEVYDNSHIQGTNALGAMIVAGPEGFAKTHYRRFTIKSADLVPGDDYGMMREVIRRRFTRLQKEDPERRLGHWPDLVLIDGGLGQLGAVRWTLEDLEIADVPLVGVAKGPDRDAGRERFFMTGREAWQMPPDDPVLYYIQRLRDEAHRFAIAGHRAKRSAAIGHSRLDEVPGIGPTRKKALLHRFGSVDRVARAGVADLAAVEGVSQALAQAIYDHFHATS